MATSQEILTWRGSNLMDSSGAKIGTIEEIYEDTDTGEPEWALVNTGLFGTKSTFVPLREASSQGDGVSVPYDKSQVKDAPRIDQEGELSRDEEAALYQHYGLNYGTSHSDSGLPQGDAGFTGSSTGTSTGADFDRSSTGTSTGADFDRSSTGTSTGADFDRSGTVGHDTSGPTTDDAMTRSEEELRVGTERQEAGRARLRKYIVTENVETTVPVQREEVRIEREPITDANLGNAMDGPALSEEEHEVVLHEERPVVEKEVVPQERVRLDKEVTTEQHRVTEQVQKEQIEIEGADMTTGTTGMTGGTDMGDDDRDVSPTSGTIDPDPRVGDELEGGDTSTTQSEHYDQAGMSPGERDRARLGDDPANQAP